MEDRCALEDSVSLLPDAVVEEDKGVEACELAAVEAIKRLHWQERKYLFNQSKYDAKLPSNCLNGEVGLPLPILA